MTHRPASLFVALPLCLLGLLAAAGLVAQERDLDVFGEVLEVRVINLEVVVTDRDGVFVSGLKPEDFRLIVDGKERPIEYFSEIRGGSAVPPAPAEGAAPAPLPAAPVEPGETVGNSYLVFIDNFFGVKPQRDRVLARVQSDLARLRPEDRMAIVAFDGKNLELVSTWTRSTIELNRVLDRAMSAQAFGLHRIAELRLFDRQIRQPGTALIDESRHNVVEEYLRKLSSNLERVSRAAATALRTLARPPGRKVMLLTAGGWARDPVYYALGEDDLQFRHYFHNTRRAFDDLVNTANLLGYTLYPVDLPGRVGRTPDASVAGDERIPDLAVGSAPAAAAVAPGGPPPLETTASLGPEGLPSQGLGNREQEVEAALLELAEETGGRAFINAVADDALAEVVRDTGSYYWLGFSPDRRRDDKEHKLKVEVGRKDLVARSRRSFRDLSRASEVTMLVESHLLFSSETGGPPLEVALGTPKKKGRNRFQLPVSLTIPLDAIVMLPGRKGFEAKLELRVAVLDDNGDRSDIPVIPVEFGGPEKPEPGAHAIYDTSLVLRRVKQRLVLALYDRAGEAVLARTIEVDPDRL